MNTERQNHTIKAMVAAAKSLTPNWEQPGAQPAMWDQMEAALKVARAEVLESVLVEMCKLCPNMPHDGPNSVEHEIVDNTFREVVTTIRAMKELPNG